MSDLSGESWYAVGLTFNKVSINANQEEIRLGNHSQAKIYPLYSTNKGRNLIQSVDWVMHLFALVTKSFPKFL